MKPTNMLRMRRRQQPGKRVRGYAVGGTVTSGYGASGDSSAAPGATPANPVAMSVSLDSRAKNPLHHAEDASALATRPSGSPSAPEGDGTVGYARGGTVRGNTVRGVRGNDESKLIRKMVGAKPKGYLKNVSYYPVGYADGGEVEDFTDPGETDPYTVDMNDTTSTDYTLQPGWIQEDDDDGEEREPGVEREPGEEPPLPGEEPPDEFADPGADEMDEEGGAGAGAPPPKTGFQPQEADPDKQPDGSPRPQTGFQQHEAPPPASSPLAALKRGMDTLYQAHGLGGDKQVADPENAPPYQVAGPMTAPPENPPVNQPVQGAGPPTAPPPAIVEGEAPETPRVQTTPPGERDPRKRLGEEALRGRNSLVEGQTAPAAPPNPDAWINRQYGAPAALRGIAKGVAGAAGAVTDAVTGIPGAAATAGKQLGEQFKEPAAAWLAGRPQPQTATEQLTDMLAGKGGYTPEQMTTLLDRIGKENPDLDTGGRIRAAYQKLESSGDMDGAMRFLQALRPSYDKTRAGMMAAAANGDFSGAIKLAQKANELIPNGQRLSFQASQNGILATVTPEQGGAAKTYQLTLPQLQKYAAPDNEATQFDHAARGADKALEAVGAQLVGQPHPGNSERGYEPGRREGQPAAGAPAAGAPPVTTGYGGQGQPAQQPPPAPQPQQAPPQYQPQRVPENPRFERTGYDVPQRQRPQQQQQPQVEPKSAEMQQYEKDLTQYQKDYREYQARLAAYNAYPYSHQRGQRERLAQSMIGRAEAQERQAEAGRRAERAEEGRNRRFEEGQRGLTERQAEAQRQRQLQTEFSQGELNKRANQLADTQDFRTRVLSDNVLLNNIGRSSTSALTGALQEIRSNRAEWDRVHANDPDRKPYQLQPHEEAVVQAAARTALQYNLLNVLPGYTPGAGVNFPQQQLQQQPQSRAAPAPTAPAAPTTPAPQGLPRQQDDQGVWHEFVAGKGWRKVR